MEPEDIDEIIKDWPVEWKSFAVDFSNSDEEPPKKKIKERRNLERRRRRSAHARSIKLCRII